MTTQLCDAGELLRLISEYGTASAAYADLVQLLTGLVDEYDRLTGRTNAPEVTADDLARCAALTA